MCSSSVEQQKEEAFYRAVIPYPAALSMKMFMTAVCTDGMHEDLVINDCIPPVIICIWWVGWLWSCSWQCSKCTLTSLRNPHPNPFPLLFYLSRGWEFCRENIQQQWVMELFSLMQSFNNLKLAVIPSTLILFTLWEQSARAREHWGLMECSVWAMAFVFSFQSWPWVPLNPTALLSLIGDSLPLICGEPWPACSLSSVNICTIVDDF